MTMLSAGDPAPDFELPDLRGQRHSLADALSRGPALVVIWKPSCGTCDLAFPYFQRLADAFDSLEPLAISQEESAETGDFAAQYGLTFPILLDGEGWPVSQRYDPEATPTFFLIAPDGTIDMTSAGFSKEELNEVSRRVAGRVGEEPRIIAEENDGKPSFRPG